MRPLFLAAIAVLVACSGRDPGSNNGPDTDSDTTTDDSAPTIPSLNRIDITPADATIFISNGSAATQTFVATGVFYDGHSEDITSRVTWSADTLGTMGGAVFTSSTSAIGRATVKASAGDDIYTTYLTVGVRENDSEATLPSNVAALFDGPNDVAHRPEVVYPNAETLFPPNIVALEVHFKPASSADTLFNVRFSNNTTNVQVATSCVQPVNGGCVFVLKGPPLALLTSANAGGDPVTIDVEATDATGTGVGTSIARVFSFAHDPLKGTLYYQTLDTAPQPMRFTFDGAHATPEAVLRESTVATGGSCLGCHAVTADGTKMVAGTGSANDGRTGLYNLVDGSALNTFGSGQKSVFASWNPSGTQYVGAFADSGTNYDLMLINGTTGLLDSTIDVGASSAHPANDPEWSPDGSSIVFVSVGVANTNYQSYNGAIGIVRSSGTTAWNAPETVYASHAGKHNFFPTFSPDSDFILFNMSSCSSGNTGGECDGVADPSAWIHAIGTSGSGDVPLDRMCYGSSLDTAPLLTSNTYPKFAPGVYQRTQDTESKVVWVTFASSRADGLYGSSGSTRRIWMAAIDPTRVRGGTDGSYPAFLVPNQGHTTTNMLGRWTKYYPGEAP